MSIVYQDGGNVDFYQVARVLSRGLDARRDWDEEKARQAFQHSAYAVYALDGDRVAGVGRALSDGYAWTLVTDVAVLPEYRRQGVGGGILERILERFRGHELFTYTYLEAVPFFEARGFKRSRNSFTYAGEGDAAIDPRLFSAEFFLPLGYRFEDETGGKTAGFPTGRKSARSRDSLRLTFTETAEGLDFGALNRLLRDAFGGRERDEAVTRATFENSPYVEFAWDRGKLVGCARAESDGVSQGFILNVAVDPACQGLHIGREITDRLAARMKGQNLFLNTHPGGVGFYNRAGFRRNKTAMLFPAHPDMPPEKARGFVLPDGYRFPDETP